MKLNITPNIYINKANENWIIDRLRSEWIDHGNYYSKYLYFANLIWVIAPWSQNKNLYSKKGNKKLICSIYHIDEDKFDLAEIEKFKARDEFVDAYHVISENSKKQVSKYTQKKIFSIPFWINDKLWFPIKNKSKLRQKYKISESAFLIGSFQRDTEGSDLKSPKLSKGPDRFIEVAKQLKKENKNLHVLLAGKRRQYIISKLKENKIDYTYFEMVSNEDLNELYNCLDLYIVTSRVEGGPQAIFESALTKTPIISTSVGVAPEILHKKSLFNMENFKEAVPDVEFAYKNAKKFTIPLGFSEFDKMFNDVLNNDDSKK